MAPTGFAYLSNIFHQLLFVFKYITNTSTNIFANKKKYLYVIAIVLHGWIMNLNWIFWQILFHILYAIKSCPGTDPEIVSTLMVHTDEILNPSWAEYEIFCEKYHHVQSYNPDKMDWTVQSWKLLYSAGNSADIGLQFPLKIDINRSGHILLLLVKFVKSFWKHLHIYCALSAFTPFRKNRYSPPKKFETRKMPFSWFPLPYNVVS